MQGGVLTQPLFVRSRNWDPHNSASVLELADIAPLYNLLVEFNPETADHFDIRGDLAESWDVSGDGLTYTFNLHSANWTDGQPVTAEDVVFSLERAIEIGKRAAFFSPYYASSEVIDSSTVEVKLKFATPLFLQFISVEYTKIVPKHVVEAGVDIGDPENIVGSGPFVVEEINQGVSSTYSRNTTYFKDGLPYVDGLVHEIIFDSALTAAGFRTGRLDTCSNGFCNVSVSQAQQPGFVADLEGLATVHLVGPTGLRGLLMNQNVPPFDNARVRLAVQRGLHRQPIVAVTGGVYPIGSPFPPDLWFSRSTEEVLTLPGFRETLSGEKNPADLTRARGLLADAGALNNLTVKVMAVSATDNQQTAEAVVDQLSRFFGWDAEVEIVDFGTMGSRLVQANFTLAITSESQALPDPAVAFDGLYRVNASRNFSNWEHPRIEALYQENIAARDEATRIRTTREAEDILVNEDTHWAGLFWELFPSIVNLRVQNFNPGITLFNNVRHEHLWIKE